MTIATTHLSFVPLWNGKQLRTLTGELGRLPGPRVLLGDLNMPPPFPRALTGWRPLARTVLGTPLVLFRDGRGRVLYVGKSTNLRSRVRQYFTASETRTRMAEMVGLAERVDPVVCSTALEAEVRELRLIAEHSPRYNRRSKRPDKALWVKLTVEAFPRLSTVRKVLDDGAVYLGPFSRAATAELAVAAVHEALPLRQCTKRLSIRTPSAACVLAEMRRCGAPCLGPFEGESVEAYAAHAQAYAAAVTGDPSRVVDALTARIATLAAAARFEDAAAQHVQGDGAAQLAHRVAAARAHAQGLSPGLPAVGEGDVVEVG
ncbi:MAG: GIY-YIG nuclease family protein [Actinobacteria bacterium]|nr:GIY-YIG nuclease family protein [Actinomycetota bacterium]